MLAAGSPNVCYIIVFCNLLNVPHVNVQVMNLQAELAYVQTHLSTLQRVPPPNPPQNSSPAEAASSYNAPLIASADDKNMSSSLLHIHCMSQQEQLPPEDIKVSTESVDFSKLLGLEDPVNEDGDLNALAREFVSKYLSGGKCRPSSPI